MQTMNKMRYYFILFLCIFLFSCDFQKQGNSTGKPLEFILIQGEGCSESAFNIFKKNFFAPQRPLLETEIYGERKNFFRVIPILEKDFSSIFRTHKNIVFVTFGKKFNMQMKKDLWAKNQSVYICSIDEYQKKSQDQIEIFSNDSAEKIKKQELIKRATNYHKSTPQNIKNYLQKNHNLSMSIPSRFFIVDSLNENLNLRGDTKKSSQRILVSSFNLEPTIENIILEQNRIAKNNISSDVEGSYVIIEERTKLYIDTLIQTNKEKINIKGLWKMEGDFMGGSFFTTLIVNPKNQKKTLISLYLYAPGENKANYLLDLEAISTSVNYVNN